MWVFLSFKLRSCLLSFLKLKQMSSPFIFSDSPSQTTPEKEQKRTISRCSSDNNSQKVKEILLKVTMLSAENERLRVVLCDYQRRIKGLSEENERLRDSRDISQSHSMSREDDLSLCTEITQGESGSLREANKNLKVEVKRLNEVISQMNSNLRSQKGKEEGALSELKLKLQKEFKKRLAEELERVEKYYEAELKRQASQIGSQKNNGLGKLEASIPLAELRNLDQDRNQIKALRVRNEQISEENNELRAQLEEIRDVFGRTKEELQKANNQVAETQKKIKEICQELEESSKGMKEAKLQIKESQKRLETLEDEIKRLNKEKQALEKEKRSLMEDIKKYEEELGACGLAIKEMESKMDEMRSTAQKWKKFQREKEDKTKKIMEEAERQFGKRLEEEKSAVEEVIQSLQSEINGLKAEARMELALKRNLKQELESSRSELEKFKRLFAEFQGDMTRIHEKTESFNASFN